MRAFRILQRLRHGGGDRVIIISCEVCDVLEKNVEGGVFLATCGRHALLLLSRLCESGNELCVNVVRLLRDHLRVRLDCGRQR